MFIFPEKNILTFEPLFRIVTKELGIIGNMQFTSSEIIVNIYIFMLIFFKGLIIDRPVDNNDYRKYLKAFLPFVPNLIFIISLITRFFQETDVSKLVLSFLNLGIAVNVSTHFSYYFLS